MAQIKRSRLFTRVLVGLVVIFAASATLSAMVAAFNLSRVLNGQYQSKGDAIARTIANASVDVLLLGQDAASLQAMVDTYAETEGVGYILVQSPEG
jgi:sensor histidine kinase regulating citrate/malate metabolism